ncbi:hypothetical protein GCM10023336_45720 [Streptomyces similanensis]|uniref:CobW C-terminal domain-containing protein n=2 Tax=Streptomyces similanensis TaxID=1274988 RepID=A0ABP9KWD3_9ACTN
MLGVVRSCGHLWLATRPDTVVSWRSAGADMELWGERDLADRRGHCGLAGGLPAHRTMASWFWDDRFGERRTEVVPTGTGLCERRVHDLLDATLLTDSELASGSKAWRTFPDPLLGEPGASGDRGGG